MSEGVDIRVTVQLERVGRQFTRGRVLGGWKLESVGDSADWVCARLESQLRKRVAKTVPTQWYEAALPAEFTRWATEVALEPPDRNSEWRESLSINLHTFRWQMGNGMVVIRVPAVGCVLFGEADDLDNNEVARQARIALLREADGLDLQQLRRRFQGREFDFRALSVSVPIGEQEDEKAKRSKDRKRTSTLRATASDLTRAQLPPIFGFEDLASQLAGHFMGEFPQSVLLVGPAGIGKTAVVHEMVRQRERLGLGDRKVWSTSGARIVSGMSGLGMWQDRCAKLIRQAHNSNAIVHLGAITELMEAGKIDGQPGVSSMMRTAIGRRRLLAIAECTPEQLAVVEREDPMLLRAFTRLEIKEHSQSRISEILRKAADDLFGAAQVESQGIEELFRLHTRFATYSALPSTALRLLRTMHDHRQQEYLVDASNVAKAFAQQSGLPGFLVDDQIDLDLDYVDSFLQKNVIGQPEPVALLVDLIATLKARLVRPGKPLASLLFIGPTGVGKTEMAKAIARLLYSDPGRMIRIDMSEYATPWAAAKLIGKPGEGDGTLTSPIREQPFSVVLLDEFEKADPTVFDLLLQLLGEGRLTDSAGRLADYRNAVVIMTSNLGADSFRDSAFGFGDTDSSGWQEHFEREVRQFVRPEFLGRIDRLVPFRPLPKSVVRQIATRELQLLRNRTGIKYGENDLEFSDEAIDLLCDLGYQPKYGARPLRRAIEEHVTVPLANELGRRDPQHVWKFRFSAEDKAIQIEAERVASRSLSPKDTELTQVNVWQELGFMARLAKRCGMVRDLENEVARTTRQVKLLRKRLELASGPRRVASLKEDVARAEAAIETSKRLRRSLFNVVRKINRQHMDLMLAWHRNEPVDWSSHAELARDLKSQLKEAAEDLQSGRESKSKICSLLVVGRGKQQLEVLWKAYMMVVEENGWQVDNYLLFDYDPARDFEGKVGGGKENAAHDDKTQPNLRLLQHVDEATEPRKKLCDLYRVIDDQHLTEQLGHAVGFAMQIRGDAVASWMEDEHGTVHFYNAQANGAKRRIRFRVSVFPDRLSSVQLSSDWKEPVAPAQRDPRRLINITHQDVSNCYGQNMAYKQGKQSATYAEMIRVEHEKALWRAIGYEGIPAEAQLSREIDIPY